MRLYLTSSVWEFIQRQVHFQKWTIISWIHFKAIRNEKRSYNLVANDSSPNHDATTSLLPFVKSVLIYFVAQDSLFLVLVSLKGGHFTGDLWSAISFRIRFRVRLDTFVTPAASKIVWLVLWGFCDKDLLIFLKSLLVVKLGLPLLCCFLSPLPSSTNLLTVQWSRFKILEISNIDFPFVRFLTI